MNQFSFSSNHPSLGHWAKNLLLLLLVFVTIRLGAQSTTTYFEDWVQSGGSGPTQVQNELLEKIATTLDGSSNLFVASTTFNDVTEVYDLLLQKFNSGGTLIWSTQYNITSGGNVLVGDLILDSSGNPIFTGSVDNGANSYDALTMKFSTSGTVTWSHTWNGTADDYDAGTSVVVDGSDNVYITGM